MAKSSETETQRTVVIERIFDVPARILFKAYSTPEHLKRWFGPPGFPLTLCEIEFKKGGRYRFQMTGPNGTGSPVFGGEYLDIVPDKKISWSNTFELPGAETMVTTVTFIEQDGKTLLRMVTVFESVAMKALHMSQGFEQGVKASFDLLDGVVRER